VTPADPPPVERIMSSPVVTVAPSTAVADAAALMADRHIGSVVVVDPGEPSRVVGILTETDLELRSQVVPMTWPAARAPRLVDRWAQTADQLEEAVRHVGALPVSEIMTRPVVTIEASRDAWEAARTMAERDVRRLPVTRDGRLVGIVARHDLLKLFIAIFRATDPAD
jgi:CBS domain-containing protein